MKRTHFEVIARSRDDIAAVAREIEALDHKGIVAYDTETGAEGETKRRWKEKAEFLPYAGAYITGISIHTSTSGRTRKLKGTYIPLGHHYGNADPRDLRVLFKALKRTPAAHMLHHCTFDWAFLQQAGDFEPAPRTVDTQIVRWLEDENAWKGLKDLGLIFLDEDADKEKRELGEYRKAVHGNLTDARRAVLAAYPELGHELKNGKLSTARPNDEGERMAQRLRQPLAWGDIPPAVMAPYAGRDATLTYEVGLAMMKRAEILNPDQTLRREMELQPILFAMTKKGVSVDVEQLNRAGAQYRVEAEELERYFKHTYGVPGMTDASKRVIVYDKLGLPCMMRTPQGDRSVAVPALEQLQGHPEVAKVMEYGHLIKARTAYAEPFAWFAEHSADGRVHGKFSSDRTVTGRLAASGPNVMTIPKDNKLPEIRKAFNVAAPGYERLGFDLKSAELWVTASITGDPNLTAILQEGRNMHIEMMVEVFGGEPDKERPEYTIAKNVNYSMAYEAGLGPIMIYAAKGGYGPSQVREIAERLIAGHRKLFRKQHAVSEFLTRKAQELGKLPLHVPGRYRHFTYGTDWYTALNALVQGGIGEFMKDMMIEIFRAGYGDLLVLQVHDELVFDAPIGMGEELHLLLEAIAADINPFKFPMHWDTHNWSNDAAQAA